MNNENKKPEIPEIFCMKGDPARGAEIRAEFEKKRQE